MLSLCSNVFRPMLTLQVCQISPNSWRKGFSFFFLLFVHLDKQVAARWVDSLHSVQVQNKLWKHIFFFKCRVLSSQPDGLIHLADTDIWFTEMKKEKSTAQWGQENKDCPFQRQLDIALLTTDHILSFTVNFAHVNITEWCFFDSHTTLAFCFGLCKWEISNPAPSPKKTSYLVFHKETPEVKIGSGL